ncbi:hypothetical protein N7537_010408 [Penicillium hordei]|uniref:RNase H type-1 domain-containing protein n=1 Tax=Penicillium hordei TaxID=40994 RepID=A0AAD6GYS2_9EURO|nr:uncharacterized protein N7537_010408 [Penicillium hordei]KAJ5593504.1 hypothetical protein N7537_010408 [Penicillium hordei]
MNLGRLQEIEMIDPTPLPPWRKEEIESERGIAIIMAEVARSTADIVVYSDASGQEGHLGAAAAVLSDSLETIDSIQVQVGPMGRWSVHAAELIGIIYAINIINKVALRHWRTSHTRVRSATILSDSKSALQAVQNPRTSRDNRSSMPFSKQPGTPRPTARRYCTTAGWRRLSPPRGAGWEHVNALPGRYLQS